MLFNALRDYRRQVCKKQMSWGSLKIVPGSLCKAIHSTSPCRCSMDTSHTFCPQTVLSSLKKANDKTVWIIKWDYMHQVLSATFGIWHVLDKGELPFPSKPGMAVEWTHLFPRPKTTSCLELFPHRCLNTEIHKVQLCRLLVHLSIPNAPFSTCSMLNRILWSISSLMCAQCYTFAVESTRGMK